MRPYRLAYLLLLRVVCHVAAQSSTVTAPGTTTESGSEAGATTTGVSRITYAQLPSCASSCVVSAIRSIPCAPFYASCFCALPAGRLAYELPVECVERRCEQHDIDEERSWRETVCAGFTSTTSLTYSSWVPTITGVTATTTAGSEATTAATEVCQRGLKGCPKGLNGGCCPNDHFCNLLDCHPYPITPTANLTSISSPTEVPPVDISALFPPCSHECISRYLPRSACGISPLNSTCFCRLHGFLDCLSPCSGDEMQAFVAAHLEICRPLLYFTPYDPTFERWCDLGEGRGKPLGYDARLGNLESQCPNWWEQRDAGKKFGIVLGILVLVFTLLYLCVGYWERTVKRVTEIDKMKVEERNRIMGI